MPRGERAPLAERAEVIKGQAVAGEMNELVEECARMSVGENEAIAIEPARR
jgi:hypothetical protein